MLRLSFFATRSRTSVKILCVLGLLAAGAVGFISGGEMRSDQIDHDTVVRPFGISRWKLFPIADPASNFLNKHV
jgi:hypothetical protein